MIKVKSVTKIYNAGLANECKALGDVSFELPGTGLVLLVGESGSGKSTLLNLLYGLDEPTTGEIINSYENNYASMVFQDFKLIDNFTVFDNLKLVNSIIKDNNSNIDEYLEKFGLKKFRNHKGKQLLSGQKQRVAIIRALMTNRPVVCCDEPTGNLDKKNSNEIAKMLYEISKTKLVIVVSHDEKLFNEYSNQIIKLSDGKIISNEIIDNRSEEASYQKQEIIFPNKMALKISLSYFKRFSFLYILTALVLTLSMICLISGLNFSINNYQKNIHHIYKENNISSVNVANVVGDYSFYSISDEEKEEALKISNGCEYYSDIMKVHEVPIHFTYLANTSNNKLLYGNNEANGNKIIISEAVGRIVMTQLKVSNLNELIGKSTKLSSEFDAFRTDSLDYIINGIVEDEAFSLVIDKNSFKSFFYNTKVILKMKGQIDSDSGSVLCYINPTLNKGQINMTTGLLSDLGLSASVYKTGWPVVMNFCGRYTMNDAYLSLNESPYVLYTYEINEIETNFLSIMEISKEDFDSLFFDTSIKSMSVWGVSLDNASLSSIEAVYDMDCVEYSIYSRKIIDSRKYVIDNYIFPLLIGIIVLLVGMIILSSLDSFLILREKKTIGIFANLGVPIKQFYRVFVYLECFIVMISFVLACSLSQLFNFIYSDKSAEKGVIKSYLYYDYKAVLISIVTIGVFFTAGLFLSRLLLSKKKTIDLLNKK